MKIKKSFFLCCLIYIASYTCFSATERDNNKYINHPGKNIYLHGPGKNSTPDNSFSTSKENNKIACANCHRRSGYGTSEGGMLVPPITGNILFNEREFKYKQLRPQKSRPITRSAYTDESLKRAIRDGIDANGRPLDLLMPRYNLSEPELNKLVRYLKSLGKEKVDGVDESTIHMATIISPYSSKSNIQSHVDTLNAFISSKNSESRLESKRKSNSPWHKQWQYSSYRMWELHIWQLNGDPKTWNEQLTNFYKHQPVFAVLGGVGNGEWHPVHNFCEQQTLPCLFPSTDTPAIEPDNMYNIYFSKGIFLEADVISEQINNKKSRNINVIQVYDDNSSNKHAAARTTTNLNKNGIQVDNYDADYFNNNHHHIFNNLDSNTVPIQLILWTEFSKLTHLSSKYMSKIDSLYTSSINISQDDGFTTTSSLYITHRHILEKNTRIKLARLRYWLKNKKVKVHDLPISANAYFAATIMHKALTRMRNNFSREYLIERIEHIVENSLFQSTFPTLSLGSEQRFASKGSYIIGPLPGTSEFWRNKGDARWVIPNN